MVKFVEVYDRTKVLLMGHNSLLGLRVLDMIDDFMWTKIWTPYENLVVLAEGRTVGMSPWMCIFKGFHMDIDRKR